MAKAWQTLEMLVDTFFDNLLEEKGVCELEVRKSNPNWALNIPDYRNSVVAVECKSKKQSFPKSILDAFAQLAAYPDAKNKVQMVVLHKNPKGDNYAVVRLDDLERLVAMAADIKCALRGS